ncbi:MAG: MBL fold metallo-hydrolase [Candidatus Pacebacteria bacterium]|nr:MBL fold metallo-hydrolase [Candidatus Paceibacterota bacterium]
MKNGAFKIILGFIVAIDLAIWYLILTPSTAGGSVLYFLNVGQGDSTLAILPGGLPGQGVKALIDGGPANGLAKKNLEEILPINDRYIDLVLISHPQTDHMGGLPDIFKNYKIGAVITNGEISENSVWQEMQKIIKENNIPQIVLAAEDKIKFNNAKIDILSPNGGAASVNDSGLVELLDINGAKALFTADVSAETEKYLADKYDLNVDILKVSHHGSKFSSAASFLSKITPAISIIEVGKNSYGHPTGDVLSRLADIDSQIFRTDQDGIIKIDFKNEKLTISTLK